MWTLFGTNIGFYAVISSKGMITEGWPLDWAALIEKIDFEQEL